MDGMGGYRSRMRAIVQLTPPPTLPGFPQRVVVAGADPGLEEAADVSVLSG